MTHTKNEALKLALEALEHMLEDAKQERLTVEYWNECVDAITAIKQALNDATHLAAPYVASQLVQEPVELKPCWYESKEKTMCRKCGQVHAEAIPPTSQPAPVQEPVAYWIPKAEQFCIADPSGRPFAKAWEPLYTTPPAAQRTWVGLTDEDIEQEFGFIDELLRDCVHRTEAKLKEKNT